MAPRSALPSPPNLPLLQCYCYSAVKHSKPACAIARYLSTCLLRKMRTTVGAHQMDERSSMEPATDGSSPSTKRRRVPKACSACRRSKVRCDERRPCTRCANSSLECQYTERPLTADERLARLEEAISDVQTRLEHNHASTTSPTARPPSSSVEIDPGDTRHPPAGPTGISSFTLRERSRIDVVSSGIVSDNDARAWFDTFFAGCDRFVPVFDRTREFLFVANLVDAGQEADVAGPD